MKFWSRISKKGSKPTINNDHSDVPEKSSTPIRDDSVDISTLRNSFSRLSASNRSTNTATNTATSMGSQEQHNCTQQYTQQQHAQQHTQQQQSSSVEHHNKNTKNTKTTKNATKNAKNNKNSHNNVNTNTKENSRASNNSTTAKTNTNTAAPLPSNSSTKRSNTSTTRGKSSGSRSSRPPVTSTAPSSHLQAFSHNGGNSNNSTFTALPFSNTTFTTRLRSYTLRTLGSGTTMYDTCKLPRGETCGAWVVVNLVRSLLVEKIFVCLCFLSFIICFCLPESLNIIS